MAGNGFRFSNEEFINNSRLVHGDRFDYSQVKYVNQYTKVKIICPEHGPFMQFPTAHQHGGHSGCKACTNAATSLRRMHTTGDFIEKAKSIHGGKYDYSNITEYRGNRYQVKIICPEHGPFMQYGRVHLAGHGCPYCAEVCDYTTFYLIRGDGFYKPGVSSKRRGSNRIRDHRRSKGFNEVEVLIPPTELVGDARDVERFALGLGRSAGLIGFQGCTEYRHYSDEDVQAIKTMVELCRK